MQEADHKAKATTRCYYHRRFGNKAQYCTTPCTYSKKLKWNTGVSSAPAENLSNRLFVSDKVSCCGLKFIAPRYKNNSSFNESRFKLQTATGTPIKVFSERQLSLNLGLRRDFKWTFIVAEVTHPILGADFLGHYKLLVDVHSKKLIDTITSLKVLCIEKTTHQYGVRAVFGAIETEIQQLFREFPNIIRSSEEPLDPKYTIVHHIDTKGPPVYHKPRR